MNSHSYRSTLITICILLLAVSVSTLNGQTSDLDKTLSPYFFVKGDPAVDRLPLKDTKVEVAVAGVIADVRVTQLYRNDGSRPINARCTKVGGISRQETVVITAGVRGFQRYRLTE